jgi:hypothetical protein
MAHRKCHFCAIIFLDWTLSNSHFIHGIYNRFSVGISKMEKNDGIIALFEVIFLRATQGIHFFCIFAAAKN